MREQLSAPFKLGSSDQIWTANRKLNQIGMDDVGFSSPTAAWRSGDRYSGLPCAAKLNQLPAARRFPTARSVLYLQRYYGNRYLQREISLTRPGDQEYKIQMESGSGIEAASGRRPRPLNVDAFTVRKQNRPPIQTKLGLQVRIQRSCSACDQELETSELADAARKDVASRTLRMGVGVRLSPGGDGLDTGNDGPILDGAPFAAPSTAGEINDSLASVGGNAVAAASADSMPGDSASAAGSQFQTDCSTLSYRDCKGGVYKCGYGGSGTCGWTGFVGKCKCLGSSQKDLLPSWLMMLLSAAAIALIVACFASGVCEAGAIVAAAGAATAAIVIGLLRGKGVDVRGEGA